MRRLFIAMQLDWAGRNREGDPTFHPRNGRMYDTAGKARHYASRIEERPLTEASTPYAQHRGHERDVVFSGYVLMVDLDTLPRVVFTDKGKAIGIATEEKPTLISEYENAERMVEIWAKRAMDLREKMGVTR